MATSLQTLSQKVDNLSQNQVDISQKLETLSQNQVTLSQNQVGFSQKLDTLSQNQAGLSLMQSSLMQKQDMLLAKQDAAGSKLDGIIYGAGFILAFFAGSGNVIKILEYIGSFLKEKTKED